MSNFWTLLNMLYRNCPSNAYMSMVLVVFFLFCFFLFLILSCFQGVVRRHTLSRGIAVRVLHVCPVETTSFFQPGFMWLAQIPWPEILSLVLSVLMTLIPSTVNGGISAHVWGNHLRSQWDQACRMSWALWWVCRQHQVKLSTLAPGEMTGSVKTCKNAKYCNYLSRIIAKSLSLF